MQRFWSPIFLSSTVAGPFSAVGDSANFDSRPLLNPNRGPMLIDQIRFSGFKFSNIYAALSVFAFEVKLGAIPLMPQPITIGSLTPRFRGVQPQASVLQGPDADTIYVWHFPKPLFVPKDVNLNASMKWQSVIPSSEPGFTQEAIRMSVVGRSLPEDEPNPDFIDVPWVTETQAKTATSSFTSSDADLVNSHKVPLRVTAFSGWNYSGNGPTLADLRVQMTASNGLVVIRDPAPFGLLFPSDRGFFSSSAVLQPGEFMRVGIEIPETSVGAPAQFTYVQFTSVAMHGYRRVPCPKANTF